MALVDIVEDALRLLQSPDALARTLKISRHELTRVLHDRQHATLEPAVVIRAARLTGRNVCDALRVVGRPALADLADELESLLRDAHSPAQQAILDDLGQLSTATRRHFIDLIADHAATERTRQAGKQAGTRVGTRAEAGASSEAAPPEIGAPSAAGAPTETGAPTDVETPALGAPRGRRPPRRRARR